MTNFGTDYEQHLSLGDIFEKNRKNSRKIIRSEEQKTKASRMVDGTPLINRENGFHNSIVETFIAELPPGGKSGNHRHMNEACLYILEGNGYSVIDDEKIEWKAGAALFVPFFVWHQHFNTGTGRARFLASVPNQLMRMLEIWKMEQKEDRS